MAQLRRTRQRIAWILADGKQPIGKAGKKSMCGQMSVCIDGLNDDGDDDDDIYHYHRRLDNNSNNNNWTTVKREEYNDYDDDDGEQEPLDIGRRRRTLARRDSMPGSARQLVAGKHDHANKQVLWVYGSYR